MCTTNSTKMFGVVSLFTFFSAIAMQPSFSAVDQLKSLHNNLSVHISPSSERDITLANLRAAIDYFGHSVRGDERYRELVSSWCHAVDKGFAALCNRPEFPYQAKAEAASVMFLLSNAMAQKHPVVQQQPQQFCPVVASPVHQQHSPVQQVVTPVEQILTRPVTQPSPPAQQVPLRPISQPLSPVQPPQPKSNAPALRVAVPAYRDGSPIGSGPTSSLQEDSPIVSGPTWYKSFPDIYGLPVQEALRTMAHADDSRADVTSPFFSPFFEPDAQQ